MKNHFNKRSIILKLRKSQLRLSKKSNKKLKSQQKRNQRKRKINNLNHFLSLELSLRKEKNKSCLTKRSKRTIRLNLAMLIITKDKTTMSVMTINHKWNKKWFYSKWIQAEYLRSKSKFHRLSMQVQCLLAWLYSRLNDNVSDQHWINSLNTLQSMRNTHLVRNS